MTDASHIENGAFNITAYQHGALRHSVQQEAVRLRLMEAVLDPYTINLIEACEVQSDWSCLELGAGAGSIAYWLAERCPAGHVSAVDIDTRNLSDALHDNLSVINVDALQLNFPIHRFDLIHARSLLIHLPQREALVEKMVKWISPCGWIILEEPMIVGIENSPYAPFRSLVSGMENLLVKQGANLRWARQLPLILSTLGLRLSHAVGRILPCGQDDVANNLWSIMFEQLRLPLLDAGLLTEAEYSSAIELLPEPSFVDMSLGMVSVAASKS
jgi:2-polyprenyl-3-methyl-5-hydroxy-6-metoxy-1,4-benzoquinol methylase